MPRVVQDARAASRPVRVFGDFPFMVSTDSADGLLADGLAEYHRDPAFRQHTDMAGLIGESLARLDRVLRS